MRLMQRRSTAVLGGAAFLFFLAKGLVWLAIAGGVTSALF